MERRRLADSLLNSKALLNTPFGNEPLLLHFKFQAASTQGSLKRSLKAFLIQR